METNSRDWLRTAFYAAFVGVFTTVMYNSFDKLFSGNTSISINKISARSLLYPSITLCPASKDDLTKSGLDDHRNWQLEDLLYMFEHSYEVNGRYSMVRF